jgi:hypothetical protein
MIPFINKLSALDTLQPAFNKNTIQVNSSLAFEVKVIKQLFANRYMLEVGNRQIESKSYMPLDIGKKYWAQMSQSKGIVQLQHLLKKPEYLQEKPPLIFKNFEFAVLKNMSVFKKTLLDALATTTSEKEFKFITDIILGLHNNVVTVPFEYRDRYALFQYRNKNKMSISKNSLEFYAEFVNLGPISGTVATRSGYKELQLEVHFQNTANYLQSQSDALGFDIFKIELGKPQPLFNLNNSLLDIKG